MGDKSAVQYARGDLDGEGPWPKPLTPSPMAMESGNLKLPTYHPSDEGTGVKAGVCWG